MSDREDAEAALRDPAVVAQLDQGRAAADHLMGHVVASVALYDAGRQDESFEEARTVTEMIAALEPDVLRDLMGHITVQAAKLYLAAHPEVAAEL